LLESADLNTSSIPLWAEAVVAVAPNSAPAPAVLAVAFRNFRLEDSM
jgi:hypothetical protein